MSFEWHIQPITSNLFFLAKLSGCDLIKCLRDNLLTKMSFVPIYIKILTYLCSFGVSRLRFSSFSVQNLMFSSKITLLSLISLYYSTLFACRQVGIIYKSTISMLVCTQIWCLSELILTYITYHPLRNRYRWLLPELPLAIPCRLLLLSHRSLPAGLL